MSENIENPMAALRIILFILTLAIAFFGTVSKKVLESMNPSFKYQAFLEIDPENYITFQLEKGPLFKYLSVFNGEEEIKVPDFTWTDDSLNFTMPIFYSEVKAKFVDNHVEGTWWKNPEDSTSKMPFYAYEANQIPEKFNNLKSADTNKKQIDFTGKWDTKFSPDTENQYVAIGEFKQTDNEITGTFMTETGDYRFLKGEVVGEEFYVSCFDGSHAFLFKGKMDGDQLKGEFWSGKHWNEPFIATQNDSAKLTNPYELTYLTQDSTAFDFAFPNLEGDTISMSDKRFENKNIVLQIFGSWCPNCMDETALYADLHKKYGKNTAFVGIAFERKGELKKDKAILEKYIKHFDLQYPILYGGKASKKLASEKFPMLNKIISFPTTIVVDKERNVVKIHTGFNGPATSVYKEYLKEFEILLQELSKS